MQKLKIADIPLVLSSHPDLTGVSVRDVINRNTVATSRGMLSIAEFVPGGFHKLHRHDAAAQISYLLSGKGEHLTENGPVPLEAGDATYVPKNTWHGFRNTGTEKAVLLSIYSPASHITLAGYETFRDAVDTTKPAHVAKSSLSKLRGDTLGSGDFLLGASTFEPGGLHEHQRHNHGDEFLYILEGGGEQLTPDGAVSLSAGEIAFIPEQEYRGFKSPPGVLTRTLFGYFGPGATHA